MTTPTTHEDGTEPRRRVSDEQLARSFLSDDYFYKEGSIDPKHALALDLRDSRAQVAALTRQLAERTAEVDLLKLGRLLRAGAVRRVRHVKSGGSYRVLDGNAHLQTSVPLTDMATVVVYQCEMDGRLWVRREEEFGDGRFEPLPDALRDHEQRGGQVTEAFDMGFAWARHLRDCHDSRDVIRTLASDLFGELAIDESKIPGFASVDDGVFAAKAAIKTALAARPAHVSAPDNTMPQDGPCDRGTIIAEAARVEREACAVVADARAIEKNRQAERWEGMAAQTAVRYRCYAMEAHEIAAAIRARNEEGRG